MQAISALDKDLALRQALTWVTQAQHAAAAAVREHGAGSTQATVADQQLEQAMLRAAQAARDKAMAEHDGASATDRDQAATAAFNRTLANLVVQAGAAAPVALRQYLANLDAAALGAIGARMETDRLGHAVLVLPGEKRVYLGVRDEATARINQLRAAIEGLPDSHWFTIYTRQIITAVQPPPKNTTGIPLPLGNDAGRLVQPFATGAIAGLKPMRPVAQVVPPQTWRVIGDRMHGDEAFIPVNDSARSQAILAETARRMGFALLPEQQRSLGMASGGLVGRTASYTNTAPPRRVLPRDHAQMAAPGQQVWSPQITVNARTDASPEHIAHAVNRHLRIRSRL
ncbi:hypothetical protein ACH347_14775 [Saccharopolyspora sp. 5N102]|uniref:hypothetical protein n=1 Tax=Saccharopolyspora sp. 5N102 TaxID=3375155 RepID=UPI0037A2A9E0